MPIITNFKKYIIIDAANLGHHCAHGSFFWYSKNFDMSTLGEIGQVEWAKNPEYMRFFTNKFQREIKTICNRIAGDFSQVIFALDCPVNQIWRMEHYPSYKANRKVAKDPSHPSFRSVFKSLYSEMIPEFCEKYGAVAIGHPRAEADDIISALTVHLKQRDPQTPIWIISTDKDLHQLIDHNVKVINQISEEIYSLENVNPAKHMFLKVILGDGGDDVPKLKNKVGIKTAEKWWDNLDEFFAMLEKDEELKRKFELNYKLMALEVVPEDIMESVNNDVTALLEWVGMNERTVDVANL